MNVLDEAAERAGPETPAVRGERGSRAVAHTVVNKIASLFLNVGTGILTARALLPEGRGELAALILWPTLLTAITSLGVPSSLVYVLRRGRAGASETIWTGLAMSLLLGIAAAIAGALAMPLWLGRQYGPTIVAEAQLLLLITPVMAVGNSARLVLEARENFAASNRIQLAMPAVALAGLIALLVAHRLTPFTAGLAYMFSVVPAFIMTILGVRPFVTGAMRVSLASARALLSYGIRSYGIDLLGTLSLQVDQVIVISLLPPAAMGTYGVMLSLSRMFNLFQSSVVMVLFPKATGQTPIAILELTERSARISTMITGVCCAIVAGLGIFVLRILYGPSYATNATCLRLLLLEVTISGAVFILAQAFMAMGHPGVVTLLQGTGLALSIPLMLWLIPTHGIDGAALSLLISTCARLFLVVAGFRFVLHVRLPQLMPTAGDLRMLADAFRRAASRRAT